MELLEPRFAFVLVCERRLKGIDADDVEDACVGDAPLARRAVCLPVAFQVSVSCLDPMPVRRLR